MANRGNSGYMKRLNAPNYFSIHRKEHKYTVRQDPGRHTLKKSVAFTIIVEKLGLASSRTEANRLIKEGLVTVNGGKAAPKYPVGLGDIVTAGPDTHVVGINNRGQIEMKSDKRAVQLYKVVGKYKSNGSTIMLRLHDGRTIKGANGTKVDDSVTISGGKLSSVIKFDAGAKCEIVDGVHVGKAGTIKSISVGNMHRQKSALVEQHNGEKFETLVKNIIVVE